MARLGGEKESPELFTWDIQTISIAIAKQIPQNHLSQGRLAGIIQYPRIDLPLPGPSMSWGLRSALEEDSIGAKLDPILLLLQSGLHIVAWACSTS